MQQLTDFYCDQCRKPLSQKVAMDDNHAWCECCKAVVVKSNLRMQPWMLGVIVALAGCFVLRIWE
ncbi:MAG: hypothetical protein ACE361_03275 [Aureliella sp.]